MPARLTRVLIGLLALLWGGMAAAEPTFTIIHVNDWDRMEERDGRGGFARVAALLAEERSAGHPVLLTHGGDMLSPSLYAIFDRGQHMVTLLNRLGVDALTPGNHEFDFGPAVAAERFAEADFPVIASNISAPDGSPFPGTVDHVLLAVGDVTLGVFGVTTETTTVVSSAGDTRFRPAADEAARASAALREAGADMVLGLTHIGARADLALARQGFADIILGGNDHVLLAYYDGDVVVGQSGSQGEHLLAIDVTVTRDTADDGTETVHWQPAFRILDTSAVAPDPVMAAQVAEIAAAHQADLAQPVAVSETSLDSRRPTVRGREAAIGNLVADALRAHFEADVALMNGGGIRAEREYPAGTTLTRGDVLAELPFNNHAVLVALSGADLRAALEVGLSAIDVRAGRFPQVAGLTVAYDSSLPVGGRVLDVHVDGVPLDPAATYTVATNNFLAGGGDGYAMLHGDDRLLAEGPLVAQLVIDHLTAAGTVAPTVEGRLVDRSGG